MFRKVFVVVVASALPILAVSTVSAAPGTCVQQYPPTSGGTVGPLARTGTDVGPMVLLGLVLVGSGALASVAATRRREPAPE